MKILIADDSAPVRTALKRCLEMNCSWQVCGEAEDGAQAVQLAEKLSPDVVLLDYGMPSMNGLEAARSIAILKPECGLILFTMFASQALKELANSVGVRAVISKEVGGMTAIVKEIEAMAAAA